jgi:ankyrin repeat protein
MDDRRRILNSGMNSIRRIRYLIFAVLLFSSSAALPQSVPDTREAVQRALPIIQKSAATFVEKRACFSCHHNALSILTLRLSQSRGFNIDAKILGAVEQKTFRELQNSNALDDAVQAATLSDPTPNESLLLMAAHASGRPSDTVTAVIAQRMATWQRDDHWVTSDFRPPHSSSPFTATATAVAALRYYMPDELSMERNAAIGRARQWLSATRPASTEDASFRLMGLVWAGEKYTHPDVRRSSDDLVAMQNTDGGWPQLSGYESDAYSTGEAVYALHEAGVPVSDRGWQKGIQFLRSSQARDGTWHVRSRMLSPADISPPYFSTGFPYGHDEYLSYAGSCWAVMALLTALPEAPTQKIETTVGKDSTAPWIRTALFGTVAELKALLDLGLDPNNKTSNGTTLLMFAAHDAPKVRLLLSRGADAKARTMSGTDAMTVAAAYRGTRDSLQLMLDAGAPPQAPEGVSTRHSPLVFASMTGDLENIRLLLKRGAEPSAEALSEAVTFGYPEIVKSLIDAGADATIAEGSGINLVHWATITNRPEVIPVLLAAKADINATDAFGFTPLMYAATVDEGNIDAAAILLKAGADRSIRNKENRTALDQAKRYKHAKLAEALRE